MRTQRWWIPAIALAAVALTVGCSGGSSKDKTPTSAASSGSSPEATTAATQSGNTSGGGNVPDVKDITQKFANATFQASYKVTGSGADAGGEPRTR